MSRKLRRIREKSGKKDGASAPDVFNQAVKSFRDGRFAEALDLCRRILSTRPQHPEALGLGGMAAFHSGDAEQAVEYLRAVTMIRPDKAEAHNDLGVVLQTIGKAEEAVISFSRAAHLNPDDAAAYNNLGVQLHKLRDLNAAEAALRRAVKADPGHGGAYNSLGNVLLDMGRFAEAEAAFRRAIDLNRNYAAAYNNLGFALRNLKRFDEAEAAYRRAVEIDRDYSDAHDGLGTILMDMNRPQEAAEHYFHALKINPDAANVHHNLGVALQSLGRLDEAVTAFRRSVEIEPARAGNSYRHLAMTKTFSRGDADVAAMEMLLSQQNENGEDAMHLSFALGKAYDDLGDYDSAFTHLARGNRIKRAGLAYDVADDEKPAEFFASGMTRDFLAANAGCGFASGVPIFIIGMPRSGTTLVEQILAGHSCVHGAGELTDMRRLAGELMRGSPDSAQFSEIISTLAPDGLSRLGQSYIDGLSRRVPTISGDAMITDKMPANFLYIGLIRLALPGAKIIHCVRDPVDTCLSCYMQYFTEGQNFAYDLNDIGRYYNAYARLMDHWRTVLPGYILDVRYEDVVADPEGEARKLLAFCGLEWEDSCLEFHKVKRSVHTASMAQVRRPIYGSSVRRWERYKDRLGPLLEALKR